MSSSVRPSNTSFILNIGDEESTPPRSSSTVRLSTASAAAPAQETTPIVQDKAELEKQQPEHDNLDSLYAYVKSHLQLNVLTQMCTQFHTHSMSVDCTKDSDLDYQLTARQQRFVLFVVFCLFFFHKMGVITLLQDPVPTIKGLARDPYFND